ncbi:MAG: DUF2125 domain-containing protein [Paracoccaceae bacterium]
MRTLAWLAAALFLLYSAWWVLGSRAALWGAETALSDLRASGRGDFASVSVAGYPSRFDLTVDRPALANPGSGLAWSAPFLQVFALAYLPNRVIAVWPHEQTLTLGPETLRIRSDDMRASATLGLSRALPLDHLTFVAQGLRAEAAPGGGTLSATSLRFATRRSAGNAGAHDIALAAGGLLPGGFALPATVAGKPAALRIDTSAAFSGPLDLNAAGGPPALTALTLNALDLTWGAVRLAGAGELTVTPSGHPDGRIDLTLADWRSGIAAAAALGLIRPELVPTWTNILAEISTSGPDPATVTLPLIFRGGLVFLGPLPLGPAPVLPGYRQ